MNETELWVAALMRLKGIYPKMIEAIDATIDERCKFEYLSKHCYKDAFELLGDFYEQAAKRRALYLADDLTSQILNRIPKLASKMLEERYVKQQSIRQVSERINIPFSTLRRKLPSALACAYQFMEEQGYDVKFCNLYFNYEIFTKTIAALRQEHNEKKATRVGGKQNKQEGLGTVMN